MKFSGTHLILKDSINSYHVKHPRITISKISAESSLPRSNYTKNKTYKSKIKDHDLKCQLHMSQGTPTVSYNGQTSVQSNRSSSSSRNDATSDREERRLNDASSAPFPDANSGQGVSLETPWSLPKNFLHHEKPALPTPPRMTKQRR